VTWDDSYSKKSEETTGVVSMLDLLIRDLTKEMTVAETEEKNAQKAYEGLMQEAAAKRAADLKSIQAKEAAKAEAEESKAAASGSSREESKKLMATHQFELQLHQECDWLQQNHQLRREARDDEVESLKQAKAILAGSDFSFVQQVTAVTLREPTTEAQNVSSPVTLTASKHAASVKQAAVGPFANDAEACTYCFNSFTKTSVVPGCICAAYPAGGSGKPPASGSGEAMTMGFLQARRSGESTMFCSSSPAAMGHVKEMGGCVCNEKNMEQMGQTTCDPISF
jgi:hypothetical protein